MKIKPEKGSVTGSIRPASDILASGFGALAKEGINVQMISQGASKVNITVICDDDEVNQVVNTLHKAFFG